MEARPTLYEFSALNALWSMGLFIVGLGVVWWKLHLLRKEIHALVVGLPRIGSEFIHAELSEMKAEIDRTQARVLIIEEQCGLNGEAREG